jgi:TRAP-type uncharacterized transport system substrate-binding protein
MTYCVGLLAKWGLVGASALFCIGLETTAAQTGTPSVYQERKREFNENVVSIIASGTTSPYTIFAEDMRNVLDEQDIPGGLRVLPILGRGGGHNAFDVLLLKGVDMGIMEKNDIEIARKKDPAIFANFEDRLRYITKLSNSEFQILGQKDIKSLRDLEGKKVNFFKKGSSTHYVCEAIFRLLNINVEPVYLDQATANAMLKTGEIAAAARFAGAPHGAFVDFKAEDNLHFLPVDDKTLPPEDFAKLLDDYLPAFITNDHFPELIPADKPVPTVAGAMLLVAYNWPPQTDRYRRVENFVDVFFSKIDEFHKPGHHRKWKEINIAAEVPGWERFEPAKQWLDKWKNSEKSATADVRLAFNEFLKSQSTVTVGSPQRREELFAKFMRWWSQEVKSSE